ncbi:hypothetical protein COU74_04525 [Candidatus Peregrinibacteria bacterium CG10_big_fil_rev_8_21_14_0_10_36_19]|nr:MAG: hypothetical protein COU74_04525 [Candidatus Peregrinibacteria bacterium CG10_big_fil_rev_8_21_14_0_10_36_19]
MSRKIHNINTRIKLEENGSHYRLAQGGKHMLICVRQDTGAYNIVGEAGPQSEIDRLEVTAKQNLLRERTLAILNQAT